MMRFIFIFGFFLLACGCQRIGIEDFKGLPQTEVSETTLPPTLPELDLDELKSELRVRSFKFTKRPEAGSAVSPQVQVFLENITGENDLAFELATDFYDEQGQLVERTEWVAFDIASGEIFQYVASTSNAYAREGRIRLRRIEPLKPEELKRTAE
jgi:hypothetical protein